MTAATITYKLVFRVPKSSAAVCKAAIFAEGAGRHPGYTECCFSSEGTGQFRPGETANPKIGSVGKVEEVTEMRIETICFGEDIATRAVVALKKVHPYEVVGYEVYEVKNF